MPVFAEYNLDELRASTDGFATDYIVLEHYEKEPNAIYHGPSSALAPPSPSSSSTAPPGLKHANSWFVPLALVCFASRGVDRHLVCTSVRLASATESELNLAVIFFGCTGGG